jgi:hypothetical protein
MHCDPQVEEHLKHARQALHDAHGAVGDHLRNAARHALQAGLAALDAAEARRKAHPAETTCAPATQAEAPPVT